ncbi:hypothetical protein HWV62_29196 [Athelia sp. TMB]|nr:hypothetical protein HWV62_29196 [Athelia sp. TMB]
MDEYGKIPSQPITWESRPTERSIGELWKDWGYRRDPESLLMFRDDTPQAAGEHLLPLEQEFSKLPEETLDGSVRMGMADMLAYAPEQGSNRSIDAFVGGVREDGDLIVLDLTLDLKPVMVKDYSFTVDIDSIIINTDELHVRDPVEVDVLPFCGKEPPMSKSNHTFAEILMPRSQAEIDADPARRTSWYSNRMSVTSLPHTFFGKIGVFNIMIVFPRLKHINPISRKAQTLLPWEMHAKFLSEVLHPAIIAVEDKETLAYKDYDINDWYWKASTTSRFSGSRKSVTVTRMAELQETMHGIIARRTESNDEDLSMFASFFFVMEAKGIKHQTMCVVGKGEKDPYTLLCESIPYLDFEKLQERENGQMLMDIGMGFHPHPRDGEHVVCLWDLERVVTSYNAAGMMAPNIFHLNTMHQYGGCQAEMKQLYAGLVQFCFRSTYGLHYEPVRRVRGGHITLCEDRDAYHANSKFFSATSDYGRQLKSAGEKDHSYGVREEIRGSGRAICEVLENISEYMKAYISAEPAICVPSKVLFEFQRRRLLDLQEVQRQMARLRPSNYGTVTTLLMHLIRSVCHAPPVMLPHLKRTLQDLKYDLVCQRFGMFFIHGLKLEAGVIEGIYHTDDDLCLKYYGIEKKKYQKKIGKHIRAPLNPTVDAALYPLGMKPSWQAWKAGMMSDALGLVRMFTYDEAWGDTIEEDASGLFKRFSSEYMITLKEEALRERPPVIETLKDAMEVWTVKGMRKIVVSSGFQPNNHGLVGSFQGARHLGFRDQMSFFFPASDPELSKSAYIPFIKYGYLKFYHQVQQLSEEKSAAVERGLQEIFQRLQILPVVNAGKLLWKSSKEQGILFWVNSKYFKLEEIGPKIRYKQQERQPKVKASNTEIIHRIRRMNDDPGVDIAAMAKENREMVQAVTAQRQKKKNLDRKSAKGKKARKPPPPRARGPIQRKVVVSSEEGEPQESDHEMEVSSDQEGRGKLGIAPKLMSSTARRQGGDDDAMEFSSDVERAPAQSPRKNNGESPEAQDAPKWTPLNPDPDSDSGNEATGYPGDSSDEDYDDSDDFDFGRAREDMFDSEESESE